MRPRPPRSMGGARHSGTFDLGIVMALAAVLWELGWVVLSLAGADPRGQLPQAFGRVWAAIGRTLSQPNHPSPNWPQILWDLGHPVSPVAVVLVVVGLATAGAVVVRLVRRVLGFSSVGGGRRGGGGGGGPSGGQPAPTVDKSLDEWLAGVAAGEDDQ